MVKRLVWFAALFLASNAIVLAQAPKPATPAPANPAAELEKIQKAKDLVREWFKRWNALDETPESINKFMELYRPDALHLTGPQDDVIGTAYYDGQAMIRKLAEHVGKTYCRQAFYIKAR